MRRTILLGAAAAILVVIGIGVAVVLSRKPPQGKLETAPTGVTVISPSTSVATTAPKPRPAPSVDRRCWTQFGGGPARTLARPALDLGVPGKVGWAHGLSGYIEFPAVYCDGTLYVNTYRGDTWAIGASTGKTLWRRRSTAKKPSSPAIAGQNVIVSAKDGTVTALDRRNGHVAWRVLVGSAVESSPAVVGDLAYFGAQDGRLFAVDASTGRIRWAFDTGGRINSSPTLTGGRVFVTTYAGSIFCLRARDGHKIWSTYVKRDALRYESFYASLSTDGARLYTIARSGKVLALSVATGHVLWTRSVNSWGYSTPAVGGDRIFVGDFAGGMHALRKTTGEEIWHTVVPGGTGRILGPPVVVGPLVFFSTLEERTYAARVSDGRIVWRYPIGKYSPGIATERGYYFSLNGILASFPRHR